MAIKFPDILEHNNSFRPLIDDGFISGGAKSVVDKTARNAIPIYKRKRGTLVSYLDGLSYVTQRYSLDDVSDSNWTNDANWDSLPFINQNLNTTDSPTFDDLTLTGNITIGGTIVGSSFLESGDNVSELTNDVGYLTSIPATYLESGDNVSELVNNAGYLTAVPSNYFNKTTDDTDDITEGTNKFVTQVQIDKLVGIEDGAEVNNISDVNATDLTDGGETTLHTHDSDNINEGTTNLFYTTARKDVAVAEYFTIACSDEITDLEAATGVVEFQMPFGMTLSGVRATVTTAPVGSTIQVDINKNGSTILSTVISIDASEKTSVTAATAPVISDTSLSDSDVITIDIDQVGGSTAGAGLKVQFIGVRT